MIKTIITIALIMLGISLFIALAVNAKQETCPQDYPWTKIDSDDLSTYPVDGAVEYCFKLGSDNSQGCVGGLFSTYPPEGGEKYCGLSHWSYRIAEPTPSVSPTATPSATPTTTPTPESSITPRTNPTITPTPEPTAKPEPTATPKPEDKEDEPKDEWQEVIDNPKVYPSGIK